MCPAPVSLAPVGLAPVGLAPVGLAPVGLAAMWLGAVSLGGCGGSPSPGAATATEAYIEALRTDDVALATERCRALTDAALQGECAGAVASRAARAGDEDSAWAICDGLAAGLWRDECGFSVVDALGVMGPDAWERCQRAGRYASYCVGHAVNRDLAALPDLPRAVGEEDALSARLLARLGEVAPPLDARHRETVLNTAAARVIAERWSATVPFTRASCGVASDALCVRAYTETMRAGAAEVDRRVVCAAPVTAPAVQAAGGVGWASGEGALPQQGWQALCAPWRRPARR